MPGRLYAATERFRKAVIAAAAEHRILRAQVAVHDFKRRAHVVIEAAHQARSDFKRDAAVGQIALHVSEVRAADFAEIIENGGQAIDGRLIFRHFAVEHAQRICFGAALAVGAEVRRDGLQSFAKFFDKLRPAVVISHGVDQQSEAAETGAREQSRPPFRSLRHR